MKKRTIILWKKIIIRSFFIFLFFFVIYELIFAPLTKINYFALDGFPDDKKEIITEQLKAEENTKFLFFISKDKMLTFSRSKFKKIITDNLPNTKSISIYPVSIHTLKIKITKYNPVFAMNDGFAIDSDAHIYKEINDVSALPLLSASSTLNKDDIKNLTTVIDKLDKAFVNINAINIDEYNDVYLLNSENKGRIVFRLNSDYDKLWRNFLSVIDTEPLKGDLDTKKSDLSYLDLRFGNKVFYKFTKVDVNSIISSATTTATTTTNYEQASSTGVLERPLR